MEKPTLTLASQPRLEQADILALLIFGRPINSLSQNEQGTLQKSAIGITTGYVAGRIANSVSDALGLDSLGVDIREVDFSGGQVGFGRYVGSKTYVSMSQQLTGDQGREVELEYQIAPDWKLGTSTTSTGVKRHRYYLAEAILGDPTGASVPCFYVTIDVCPSASKVAHRSCRPHDVGRVIFSSNFLVRPGSTSRVGLDRSSSWRRCS